MPDLYLIFIGFIAISIILILFLIIIALILICILIKNLVSLKSDKAVNDNNIDYNDYTKSDKKKKRVKEEFIKRSNGDITLDSLQQDFSEKPKFESNFNLNTRTIIDNGLDDAVKNLKKNI